MGDIKDTYVCDRIGERSELAHLKKLGGTGGNEAAHRYVSALIFLVSDVPDFLLVEMAFFFFA